MWGDNDMSILNHIFMQIPHRRNCYGPFKKCQSTTTGKAQSVRSQYSVQETDRQNVWTLTVFLLPSPFTPLRPQATGRHQPYSMQVFASSVHRHIQRHTFQPNQIDKINLGKLHTLGKNIMSSRPVRTNSKIQSQKAKNLKSNEFHNLPWWANTKILFFN